MNRPGDKPECCKDGREIIFWAEAEGPGEWLTEDGWAIPVAGGGDTTLVPVWYCPFCGHELGDPNRWADGRAAVERFKAALPAVMQQAMSPGSDLQSIAEAIYVAFIDPIERRLRERS